MASEGSVFYRIPGNIKQQCLPFVINPKSENSLTKGVESSNGLTSGTFYPQIFTYKPKGFYGEHGSFGGSDQRARLNFIPISFERYVEDDISYQLTLNSHSSNIEKELEDAAVMKNTFKTIIGNLPGVKIREFIPDTQLDQTIKMFADLFEQIKNGFGDISTEEGVESALDKAKNLTWDDIKKKAIQVWRTTKFIARYMTGTTTEGSGPVSLLRDFQNEMFGSIPGLFSSYDHEFVIATNKPGFKILTFPYLLYYEMQSYTTTNIYEIPNQQAIKNILESSGGMTGWTDSDPGGINFSGLVNKIPLIGQFLAPMVQNLGINYMPWWSSFTGTVTREPEVEVSFNLFNDTEEAAIKNFIFINTIIPNNKWIQFGLFQHCSNLYDVQIEGINRLFACAGAFKVDGLGVLRNPTYHFVRELVDKHANPNSIKDSSQQFITNIIENNLIKIPDVYHVTLKFQSLLPANFNNYLYIFTHTDIIKRYSNKNAYNNEIEEKSKKFSDKLCSRVKNAWKQAETTSVSEFIDFAAASESSEDDIMTDEEA